MLDENIPGDVVAAFRALGYDVVWVRQAMPGAGDTAILARAQREKRIVVTFDKDFGELAYRANLPASSGVILLRLRLRSAADAVHRIVAIITARNDWPGHFSVVDERRIRMTPLPPACPR
ncbi:MAG: DUF5615 family PIN-like protein [Dehalococcoidia bacterium]